MKIKMLVMDIDGTLTDGRIYIGPDGEMMKAFDVKDGYGIVHLKEYEIIPVVITGRSSCIVERRMKELQINEYHQGVEDKLEKLKEIADKYEISPEEIACIGDDLNDLQCISFCGISGCPEDALTEIKLNVDYICKRSGGRGAVREFIDFLEGKGAYISR